MTAVPTSREPHPELSGGAPVIRLAIERDIDALSAMVSDAMADYSWTRWTLPPDDYTNRLRRIQRLYLTWVALPYGKVWTTADHSAAAAFIPATVPVLPPAFGEQLAALHGDRLEAVLSAEAQLATIRPKHDWTLACAAVHPALQRSGLGSAVTGAGLADLDSFRGTCLVETSSEANVRFYVRLGWQHVTSVRPDDGPVVHLLLREHGAARATS